MNVLTSFFSKPENILFIPVFLIIISVLVAAHEYGHYLFARIFGMGIEEFAIGFGRKPIWTYRKKTYLIPIGANEVVRDRLESPATDGYGLESPNRKMIPAVVVETPNGPAVKETTNFTVRAWPLGGFVRIKGMMPEDDGSETMIPGGFYSKAPWKRFIVLLAGPVFSVLAGVVLIFIVYATVGAPVMDKNAVVGDVYEKSPAQAAGLKTGDRIVEIDSVPIKSTFDVLDHVRFAGEKHHSLVYERDGKRFTTDIVPETNKVETMVVSPNLEPTGKFAKQAMIGISWHMVYAPMSLGTAATEAVTGPARAIAMMGSLLKTPSKLKENVGGPITMLKETRQAVSGGFPSIMFTAAMLSISVGIFNLLPIPPLDGGQMAIAVAEMFRRGKRLSMRVQNIAAAAGMLMVLLLVVTVFTIDIQRMGKPDKPEFKEVVEKQAQDQKR